ncbi:T6SS phospholipase effector Tle1-like catalytic domain-containing protein, partial [Archangium sp.]|uniref:T6SS phospholipase effector Tle1-like catalytic domain-containing protein n=1 Tax=Archangium sp. TaxID=1872627 RepID=UPI00389A465C
GEDRLQWAMGKLEKRIKDSGGKGGTINVALFGFSRGATLARAFAVRIAKLSEKKSGVWHFIPARQPIRLYFLGLFDTVASVGLAISANNNGAIGQVSPGGAMSQRYSPSMGSRVDPNSPWAIATGATPGADPAKGLFDGHSSWADELHVPEMVEGCFHLAAGHEIRNSFPLDSVLQGNFYPKNCWEMILPGVHSDVGGGYRPGEGARSLKPGSMLSLIPLRLMRDTALHAKVPLLKTIPDKKRLKDFGMDEGSAGEYKKLLERFNHYMNAVKGGAGEPLGRQVLAHMRVYYQWRFYKIAANMKAWKAGLPTQDEAILREYEPRWAAQKSATQAEMDKLDAESKRYHDDYDKAMWSMIRQSRPEYQGGPTREQLDGVRKLMDTSKQKRNEYLGVKAVQDTLPGSDGSLEKNLRLYDAQLLTDALMLKLMSFTGKLRPHYKALLDAYEAEFKHNKGLRDEKIIAFFDESVHDSLASFAGDATLPSDPRVIFIGGNTRLQYAVKQPQRPSVSQLA